MSQTLQNQILLAKSMNGIVSLSDGAGTTITGGQVITNDFSGNTISVNSFSTGTFDLNNSLTLEQYDNISTAVGLVSLWEKGKSYFTYLPKSLATPSNNNDLITLLYGNANYGRLTQTNTWSGTNTWTGVNTFNNNFTANCPITTGSIRLRYNNANMIEISQYALYSPISIAPGFGQITFNYSPVFRASFSLDNNITMSIGSPYAGATLEIYTDGVVNGQFKTNTIEPTNGTFNSTWYTGVQDGTTLTFGNDGAVLTELSVQFANTTFNRGLTILDNITADSLTITPTQLSFLNNVSSGTIPTSAVAAGFCDTTTNQTVGGIKTFSSPPVMSGASITSSTIPVSAIAGGVVDTTTNQTVGGIKTFSSPPVMSGASITSSTIPVSAIAGGVVDITTNGQQISGRKDFNGFDNTAPNYCGTSLVSPVFRPRLYTLSDSINNSCHVVGSNTGRNLAVDPTNTGCFFMGQDNLPNKTLNSFNVCSIGGANMGNFTSESFSGVSVLGQANLELESGYTMNRVCIFGGGTQFNPAAVAPTSVQNAAFFNSYGISLPSAAAITNVFGINTQQPITKSNQGIIGDSTEITLHSTGQKVVITGGLELDGFLSSSISPILNWSSANFNLSSTTAFFQYYHFILNAATTITLPIITSAMVGQEFTLKRRGGTLSILSITTSATGGALQPVFPIGGSLGVVAFPYALISAAQSTAKLMCIRSHVAGTGTASCPGSSTVLTVSAWNVPTSLLTIGTRITISTFTKTIVSYGTGTGRTGTYNIDTAFGVSAVSGTMTSADRFGYDILLVQ